MKEQFDKKLVEKIKGSFENHEEPFNQKEWEKFSRVYFKPRRKKWKVYWPFISAGIAASLVLMLFYWPGKNGFLDEVNSLTETLNIDQKPFGDAGILRERYTLGEDGEKERGEGETESTIKNKGESRRPSETVTSSSEREETGITGDPIASIDWEELEKNIAEDLDSWAETILSQNIGSGEIQEKKSGLEFQMDLETAESLVENWKKEELGGTFSEMGKKEKGQPVKLGLVVSPQSSSNPAAGMNLGAGVMSEFSLSRRLKLDVGVAYARQSLSPENTSRVPQSAALAEYSTSSSFMGSSYELNFSSLDIPINLKYKVMEKKNSGLFLITGLSSMVYLNQHTTETFTTNSLFTANSDGTLSFSRAVQEFTTVISPEGTESMADLGRMLNLSVGYEYNLKNGMFISFEPFYKLPLGSLTFANQQFSIGGLNLRMNFKLGK